MSKLIPITVACAEYDRTRPIKDGRVPVDGCEVTYLPLGPEELFFRAFRYHEFDVAELSFNSYLMQTSRGTCPYVAVPAFVSRRFRHSAVFIRTDRGLKTPADLKGKLVGLPEYQQTANVWMRGIFKDEYGVNPADIRWRNGGQEEPGRDERTPLKLTNGVELKPIPSDKTLNGMLVSGELDAVFSARALSSYLKSAPNVGLLFPNYREAERAYFQKSRMFPIMHLIGIKRTMVERYPWLPGSVYKAFLKAKEIALAELAEVAANNVTLPWPEIDIHDAVELMGRDYWRYGVKECAHEIETLVRYSHDQGLMPRMLSAEEIFHPSVFEISKV